MREHFKTNLFHNFMNVIKMLMMRLETNAILNTTILIRNVFYARQDVVEGKNKMNEVLTDIVIFCAILS